MCGRVNQRTPLTVLAKQFAAETKLLWSGARFNVAPTQDMLAVRQGESGREIVALHWGLIPIWAKDKKIAYSTINARADTVATKPAFRSAFKSRRCLALVDGYYEWLREGKSKLPFHYQIDDGKPFALAGLWESWRGPDGKSETPLESCALITTEANELAAEVHDRMPVILDPCDYDAWLDPANQDKDELQRLLLPFDSGRMTVTPVSTYVNNARNQGPKCIAPISAH